MNYNILQNTNIRRAKTDGSSGSGGGGYDYGNLMKGISGAAGTVTKFIGDIVDANRSKVDISGMNYNDQVISSPMDIANYHTHAINTNAIEAPSAGKQAGNVFSKMNEGALAGGQINMPWGLIAGAAVGLGSGIAEAFTQNATYRNDVAKGNIANTNAARTANKMIGQGTDRILAMSGISDRFNRFAQGGTMNEQYTNQDLYNTNNNIIGTGGIHEMNPNGGVPQGVDGSGTPNLVEEGEFVYTDLDSGEKRVLSNRVEPDLALFSKVNLNEKMLTESYAKSAEKIIAMFDGRNDPFSNKTKNMLLNRLFAAQEEQKLNEAAAEQGMTPEEYVAAIQQQQAQEQAMQQQMAMQQQQQFPPEVIQLAQQYGVSPEEIIAQLQQQQGLQTPPEMMAYDDSMMPDEMGMQGNYGALGGTFEYGPISDVNPIMGYDNYLLQRSRVNTSPVNNYDGGGPVLTGKTDIQTLEDNMKYLYNNDPSEFDNIVNQYNKLKGTNYDRSTYFSKSSDGIPGPIHDYNMYYLGNTPVTSPKSSSASGWDIPDYLFEPSEFPIEEIESSEFPITDNPKTKSRNAASNWDRARNALGIMNPLRFAGAADAFRQWVHPESLDTQYADFLKSQYNPITYTGPIGQHQVFHPIDSYRNLGIAQSARAAAIARNNEMSPNSRINTVANMAADRMYNNQLGEMFTRDTQTNFDRYNAVKAYNNQLDVANNQNMNAIHQYNTQHRADTVGRGAMAYEASKDARKAAIDQARDTYVKNLQNIGQELSYRNYIDSNPSFAYTSFNDYKTGMDYARWLRENGLDDSPENWYQFRTSR